MTDYCKQQPCLFTVVVGRNPFGNRKNLAVSDISVREAVCMRVHTYDVYPPVRLHSPLIHHANCIRSLGQRGHGNGDHDHGSVRVWQAVTVWLAPGAGGYRRARFPLTQCAVNWQLLLVAADPRAQDCCSMLKPGPIVYYENSVCCVIYSIYAGEWTHARKYAYLCVYFV